MAGVGRNGAVIEGINEQLMKAQLVLSGKSNAAVVVAAYGPTETAEEVDKEGFWTELPVTCHKSLLENISSL